MLRPDIETASVDASVRGGASPHWLLGNHAGQRVFILGGARGLAKHPGLPALRGEVVIGTNWTLELLRPTYLQIADAEVWNHQSSKIQRCSTVVLAHEGIFGAKGYYSRKSPNVARVVGRDFGPRIVRFAIQIPKRGQRDKETGVFRRTMEPPFLVDELKPFHYSGNSCGYALQWAHLMGASEVYLMGFTMKNYSGYFFTPNVRPTKGSGKYDPRIMDFLRFVNQSKPGWVKIVRGWEGPIYNVGFEEVELTEEGIEVAKEGIRLKKVKPSEGATRSPW